jgi:hypothetical protein
MLFGRFRHRWKDNVETDMKQVVKLWTGCNSLRLLMAGSCERGNEPSGSTKGSVFLDQLSNYQLLKSDSTPRS